MQTKRKIITLTIGFIIAFFSAIGLLSLWASSLY